MIRDPSDGTVKSVIGKSQTTEISGLPIDKHKAEEQARLDKSREWMKAYREQEK